LKPISLLRQRNYSLDWVKDFYTQSNIWWGSDPGQEYYPGRIQAVERLCGPGTKRILELGAGSGAVAAEMAKSGHAVVAVELTAAIQSVISIPCTAAGSMNGSLPHARRMPWPKQFAAIRLQT
jgi:hypothetical protein